MIRVVSVRVQTCRNRRLIRVYYVKCTEFVSNLSYIGDTDIETRCVCIRFIIDYYYNYYYY